MPIPRKKAVPKSPSPDTFSLKEEAISENAEGTAYQLIPTAPSFAAIHMIELRLPPSESSLTCDGERIGSYEFVGLFLPDGLFVTLRLGDALGYLPVPRLFPLKHPVDSQHHHRGGGCRLVYSSLYDQRLADRRCFHVSQPSP